MIYIVDLDDTLVSSTNLNNDAYNYALNEFNLGLIKTEKRITRDSLKIDNKELKKEIIQLKQKYFVQKWLKYRVVLNDYLLEKIKNNKGKCYLWTKADKNRVKEMVEQCNLSYLFNSIIYDKKQNIKQSLSMMKNISCNQDFVIFENDKTLLPKQNCQIIDTIKNKYFNVNGYLYINKS